MRLKYLAVVKRRVVTVLFLLVLLSYTLLTVFPFIWTLLLSLRPASQILINPYGLPLPLYFKNFFEVLFNPTLNFGRFVLNSIIVTAVALVISTTAATMGAFVLGRLRYSFPIREGIYTLIFISIFFPPQITLLSLFQILIKFRLYNTRLSLILVYSANALPFSIFILRTFFKQIPRELEDAAFIDGCNDRQVFWRVMFPVAQPAIATIIIVNFINFWNEFLYAVTFINKHELRTIPLAVMFFIGESVTDYGMLAASLIIAMLPVIVVYLFLSELFIKGMTAGSIKG